MSDRAAEEGRDKRKKERGREWDQSTGDGGVQSWARRQLVIPLTLPRRDRPARVQTYIYMYI